MWYSGWGQWTTNVEATARSELATVEIELVDDGKVRKFTLSVLAQDSFTNKTYDLNILRLSQSVDFNNETIKIYPNPVNGFL